ncbi:putative ribosomal oxygenase [Gracilariopsis chorda]|uniref:Bifunctional lysine-specific demethylase and histidyl-hydroxylase n=1 Tax=Gracilariopsis chorda TaxID=448386 RepID=A0A2V3J3Q4_9FLOR|nr:putative ribosomal oxygenase [Gracilariopsis chorda]|eukprot:PXF49025.1 putative ribosomal oxygenase [Gracilariopsis chorda]
MRRSFFQHDFCSTHTFISPPWGLQRNASRSNRTIFCALTPHPLLTSPKAQKAFLTDVWGQKPYLLRNLLPVQSLTPDELAGLSLHLPSRIIRGRGDGETQGPYTLENGPFSEHSFATLPDRDWTLLVDRVNQCVPQVADLLDNFRFLPNWRLDDVMISYAPMGGSVGPHVDNYDVFLLQTSGRRLWKTAYSPINIHQERLVPGLDVRILQGGFKSDEQWVLEPGDALYVPPRYPHHGISMGDDCVTYSIGFRAPSVASLLSGWITELVHQQGLWDHLLKDDLHALLESISDPSRLSDATIEKAYNTVLSKLRDDKGTKRLFRTWFASHVSQLGGGANEQDEASADEAEMEQMILDILDLNENASDFVVRQKEGSVFVYLVGGEKVCMYIDGEEWHADNTQLASFICGRRSRSAAEYARLYKSHPSLKPLLRNLLHAGLLYVDGSTLVDELYYEGTDSGLERSVD